jgi:hypothetical protein
LKYLTDHHAIFLSPLFDIIRSIHPQNLPFTKPSYLVHMYVMSAQIRIKPQQLSMSLCHFSWLSISQYTFGAKLDMIPGTPSKKF